MKQNLPPANSGASSVVIPLLVLAQCLLMVSACATRSRSSSATVQTHLVLAKVETASPTNINTAGTEELEKLPGVGKVIAERIVAHREQYGPFRRAEHLMMVRGVSDNKFRLLRTLIVVE